MPIMSKQWLTELKDERPKKIPYPWSPGRHYVSPNLRGRRLTRLTRMAERLRGSVHLDRLEEKLRRGQTDKMCDAGTSLYATCVGRDFDGVDYLVTALQTPTGAGKFGVRMADVIEQVYREMVDLVRRQVAADVRAEVAAAFEPLVGQCDRVRTALMPSIHFGNGTQFGYLDLPRWVILEYYARSGVYFTTYQLTIMRAMVSIGRNVSIWWPTMNRAMVMLVRPQVKFDPQGRLHSETGPAINFGDGHLQYYAWRGQIVPAEWFTQKGYLTAKRALGYRNAELRRAACDKLGWDNILKELDARVIDQSRNPQIGTLVQVSIDGQLERFLRVRCGTGREFALPVPRNMRSAIEANAWTYGKDPWSFRVPEVRT